MPKCDLKVKLDHPAKTYEAGSTITGSVVVRVESDCECRALTLSHGWRTSGKGNPDGAGLGEAKLFSGHWGAGEVASYPFELEAQPGPVSYRGKVFNVEWHILAQADIPIALDLKADEEYVLVSGEPAGDAAEPIEGTTAEANTSGVKTGSSNPSPGPAVGVGIGVATSLLAAYLFWGLYPALSAGAISEVPLWKLLTAIACGLIGLLTVVECVPRLVAARKIGAVDAQLGPTTLRRGSSLTCAVSFLPRADITLRRATLILWATEVSSERVSDDDNNKEHTKYYTERVYSTEVWLASERQLKTDQAVTLEGTVKIPPGVPASFKGIWNELSWRAAVRLNLHRCPDWEREFPVEVRA